MVFDAAEWCWTSRQATSSQLLAATFVTVMIAVPVLVAAASIEVYVSPQLLQLILG